MVDFAVRRGDLDRDDHRRRPVLALAAATVQTVEVGDDLSAMILAFVVIGMLILLMRWIFTPSHPRGAGPLVDASDSRELGLLDVVATALPRAAALQARAALGAVGIRSSMSRRRNGHLDVLVFQADADRARDLLR